MKLRRGISFKKAFFIVLIIHIVVISLALGYFELRDLFTKKERIAHRERLLEKTLDSNAWPKPELNQRPITVIKKVNNGFRLKTREECTPKEWAMQTKWIKEELARRKALNIVVVD